MPVASRLSPPAEAVQPTRSEPRVYGAARSAAVDDEPASQPVAQVEPIVPAQAVAPVQENTGRPAVARASVSVGRVSPVEAIQPPAPTQPGVYGRPQSTVYGSPAAAAQAAAAQTVSPQQEAAPQPLLSPQQGVYGGAATGGPTQTVGAGQRASGMPPYGDLLGPATPQSPPQQQAPSRQLPQQPPSNTMVPSQRAPLAQPEPAPDRFNNFKPAEEPPAPVRSSKVLLVVILACVLLLGLALGTLWVVAEMVDDKPTSFGVGACVKQEGTTAVTAACTDAGAFQVTEIVTEKGKCPDVTQPTIEQAGGILCLKPASATAPVDGATPTPTP